jgi:hypothetical protein
MDLFRTRTHAHLVPIHPKNAKSKDWVILLEASTIVGPSPDRLRVASTTQEKKVVWRFKSRWSQPFLVVDGYDPRIHVLYFCPQLYKFDGDNKLVPLPGEEIGKLSRRRSRERSSQGAHGTNRWTNCLKSELSVSERLTLSLWKGLPGTLKLSLPRPGPEQPRNLSGRRPDRCRGKSRHRCT